MSVEEKIRHLLRAARRVEDEGDTRGAELLRRMAEEALPVECRKRTLAAGCGEDR